MSPPGEAASQSGCSTSATQALCVEFVGCVGFRVCRGCGVWDSIGFGVGRVEGL